MAAKLPNITDDPRVMETIRRALKEDIGSGDVTTLALVPERARAKAVIIARRDYVVSGTDVARAVFREVSADMKCTVRHGDGRKVAAGETIMTISGPAGGILTGERTALNFMQRMTGIATVTRRFADAVAKTGTRILDTRKTTPTLRLFEKYAVLCGGGTNHRMGLYDMALLKDNHRALWAQQHGGRLDQAVNEIRRKFLGVEIEVEVENEAQLRSALDAMPEWILLDNMTPDLMRQCVKINRGRCKLEASGGVSLETVAAIAATGVDAISIGALTHSAPAADLSLEIVG